MKVTVDVLVIGAGPGGYTAAIRTAQLGKHVAIVEQDALGGVCLNRGCIPSKALISAAHQLEVVNGAASIGIEAGEAKVSFTKVQEWKNGIVHKLTSGVQSLLKANKVQKLTGRASFLSPNEVRIEGEETIACHFMHCIIATGSRPIELPAFPYGGRILSSTEALALDEIPQTMIVLGGGYIGIELGQTYAKFGTKVTIIEGTDAILPGFEKEASRFVSRTLKKLGVQVFTQAMAESAEQTNEAVTVTFTHKGEAQQVTADYLLVTVGRRPNLEALGLDQIGIEHTERGLLRVDEQGRTSVPTIYAIGDIVAGVALAHKASYEGKVAAEAIAGLDSTVDYRVIPAVVFSDPEIASVGISETEAKEQGRSIVTGKFPYAANGRALSLNAGEGFVKIIADKEEGTVLGAQIVGPEASNLIAELGLAIEAGITLEEISQTIHAHPTLGEIVMEAAESALGRAIHQVNKPTATAVK
ncbi:dihydrolipoyl dehydrogenase [Aneurinibacillus migulanus]|uniref:Dihydrolipoyl dehydrogenase n=1 Tax=Aneurinibacillus migulanus TaxID=47500 RepID=A0A0D1YG35_ANEMI|nr:dihydrolipoyl dehydrogenase [Aneurinibacillus migulanus]KIV57877.1 dihydrolipoamide dehydrogenase [Aneurinibacillus migulanus]KON97366.1 dihydrolipoamide dehydrogenase [Aneurinibacillus migulanus]MED0893954.1 dihydrolipoyl dehydrogenase [Aneurinibacillus migulanus]MED1616719.1 dihydrolipoyl dehydrogenase [Aneurinibacillus migulanus]SDJ00423.1 dihydrolipoamide dehydrogenase [Aneurinibacillus migulanus]